MADRTPHCHSGDAARRAPCIWTPLLVTKHTRAVRDSQTDSRDQERARASTELRRHYNPASLPQLAVIAIDRYWGATAAIAALPAVTERHPTAKIQCAHSAVQGQDEAGPQRLSIVKSALADLTTATRQGRGRLARLQAAWRGE